MGGEERIYGKEGLGILGNDLFSSFAFRHWTGQIMRTLHLSPLHGHRLRGPSTTAPTSDYGCRVRLHWRSADRSDGDVLKII